MSVYWFHKIKNEWHPIATEDVPPIIRHECHDCDLDITTFVMEYLEYQCRTIPSV